MCGRVNVPTQQQRLKSQSEADYDRVVLQVKRWRRKPEKLMTYPKALMAVW
ncbi:hypothetical protein SEA_PINKIEPIE_161 [Streptomyces phage PinkiePie]|nr:hypothetical protein SEA_PINKIEPIE_161 [Streptomyces phage PinkiePie]